MQKDAQVSVQKGVSVTVANERKAQNISFKCNGYFQMSACQTLVI